MGFSSVAYSAKSGAFLAGGSDGTVYFWKGTSISTPQIDGKPDLLDFLQKDASIPPTMNAQRENKRINAQVCPKIDCKPIIPARP